MRRGEGERRGEREGEGEEGRRKERAQTSMKQ